MSSLNRETKFLLSTVLPTFERVCKHTVACNNNLTVSHLTVVRLSSDGFGHIFRYCPEDVLSDHALESQESDIAVNVELHNCVFDVIPPAELQKFEGRHILLGSIPEWNGTLEYPMSLRVEPVRVVLNVRWYIMADQPPLSMPMMGWVKNSQIHVPISQAITQEMFSDFNPWYVPLPMLHITPWKPRAVEVWSSASGQWEEPRTPGMLCILLPFNKVPLLRFKAVHPYRWQRFPEQALRSYLLQVPYI
ncbi:hypothetical protein FOMPIDRAFT_1050179 [Fomitopsis schrenkii]|uniref:Uncharacterized protein n=1 Tax=Fomitopsis schrenkii TaxID=2126942 RepID=S8FNF2_FOMSC|nr:hypothetical protein FOMPIDRAFT_1050179 [Fomitopsis schrenkii]